MVTIQDVARCAGVSVATVSRVINGKGHVRQALRERVERAVAELNYEPNLLARNWRTRTTRTVAAVIASIASPHEARTLQTAEQVALAHDYNIILCDTSRNAEVEARYLRMVRQRRVDGVLLNTMGQCQAEIRALTEQGVPVVMLNRPLGDYGPLVDAVVVDSHRGAMEAVEHLIRVGHRRIGLLSGPLAEFHGRERLRGYVDALRAHGLPQDESLIRFGNFDEQLAATEMEEFIHMPSPPSAIFAAGYSMARAAMAVLRAHGLRIPDDMALAMFDDVVWGDFIDPPLTVVSNPARELGRTAMELLLARLADHERPPQEIWLAPKLIVRRSCGWTGPIEGEATAAASCKHPCDRPERRSVGA